MIRDARIPLFSLLTAGLSRPFSIAIHCYSLYCHTEESHGGSVLFGRLVHNKKARNSNCRPNGRLVPESSCFVAQNGICPIPCRRCLHPPDLWMEWIKGCPAAPLWIEFSLGISSRKEKRRDWRLNSQVDCAHRSPQKASGHWLTPCNSRITQNWQHLGSNIKQHLIVRNTTIF